jgi:glycosyltransferase involved in cell wall biosynthesis
MSFSIIIPHKNDLLRLSNLLHSIPLDLIHECIVVDDGSDEVNNPSQLKQHFKNVTFVVNKCSKGAGGARNTGLDIATGNWILFADSDDFFTLDAFRILKIVIDDAIDVIYFAPDGFREDDKKLSIRHEKYSEFVGNYLNNPSEKSDFNLRYRFIIPTSKLISRAFILKHKIRFEESLHANDILFSVKVGYYAKKIKADSGIIYRINHREGSLTTQINRTSFEIRLNEFIKTYDFLRQNLDQEKLKILDYSYEAKNYVVRSFLYFKSPKYSIDTYVSLRSAHIRTVSFRDLCFFEKNNYFRISIVRFLRGNR